MVRAKVKNLSSIKKTNPVLYNKLSVRAKMYSHSKKKGRFCLNANKILVTPINVDGKNPTLKGAFARNHYSTEQEHVNTKQWDQPIPYKLQANINDLFGYAITSGEHDYLEIFNIISISGPENRRARWNIDINEHNDRGVVFLSEYIGWVSTRSFVKSKTNAPARLDNKLLTINGTVVYDWDRTLELYSV